MVYFRDFLFYLSVLIIPIEIRGHTVNISNSDCVGCELHAFAAPELLDSERGKRSIPKGKLVGNEELCKDHVPLDDLAALDCILTSDIRKVNRISEACKSIIWAHSLDFLEDSSLRSGLQFSCHNELQSFSECLSPSNLPDTTSSSPVSPFLTCILDRKESVLIPKCKSFLQQVERVILFDFSQVTGPLAKYCESDVKQLECHHNQFSWEGGTLACLRLKLDQIKDELC